MNDSTPHKVKRPGRGFLETVQLNLDRVVLVIALARIASAMVLLPNGPSSDDSDLLQYAVTGLVALLGTWLYIGQQLDERARLLGITCIVGASAFASAVANQWLPVAEPPKWQNHLADLVNRVYVDGFLSWYLWRLVTIFPKAHDLALTRRILRWGTGLSLAGALVVEIGTVIWIAQGPAAGPGGLEPRVRDETLVLWLLAAAAVALLAVRYYRATSLERRRSRVVGLAFLALFAALCVVVVSMLVPSSLEKTTEQFQVFLGIALLLAFALFTTYAWIAQGALDARLSIQKLVTFRLTQLLIVLVSIGPMGAFVYLFNQDGTLSSGANRGPSFLLLALGIFALQMGGAVFRSVSRRQRGTQEERLGALEDFSRELRDIRTGQQLSDSVMRLGRDGFKAEGACLLLAPSFPGRYSELERLPANSLLPGLFELRDAPLFREHQDPYQTEGKLTEADRQLLDNIGAAVAAPVRSAEGFVLAVLAVGQKSNQTAFTPAEAAGIRHAALLASFKLGQWNLDHSEAFVRTDDAASRCVICDGVFAGDVLTCPTCSGPTAEADIPWKLEDRFLFEQRLGQGAFGSVYCARDLRLHRQVAIKVLGRTRGSGFALSKEASATAQLEHPHIASVYGLEDWAGKRLMVTEYLEGGTLEHRLEEGALEEQEAVALVQDVATALQSAHSQGFLHGDIKPSNIGFTRGGHCKLIDLGLTSLMSEAPTEFQSRGSDPDLLATRRLSGGAMGTPLYASPEMWTNAPAEKTNDLWGLLVVLFQATTGQPPFSGANADEVRDQILTGRITQRALLNSRSDALSRFLVRGLALEPASRYVDAEELLTEMLKLWPDLRRRRASRS